ncbi:HAMP domain-containing sensor histidine kinase [Serratia marcescens]|uniref:sensor histidine kinase n=1 Tax=Serratia TaxID=613 RepID=UPI0011C79D88|nr:MULTISPECIES: HAMP domain-containing sensor histidine kinase [Serratia]MDI6934263.1 HAMP domain-containing sensor histidine kinase [Serratia sp. Se-PFBMAAmG]MBH2765528.1 HAMP domain-containing histidine kinase [Serratia marcescens]MBN5313779.1 HAMP domain-containing histidine kinase [Serratia marcescens]MDI6978296.1 HAMP domain-containing sensor histidine kinase [Serratia sp. Se-RSBMAAmG]MDI9266313.1 HAMP domain-containing sensor histidine kinase [Serratia sp. PF2-63]
MSKKLIGTLIALVAIFSLLILLIAINFGGVKERYKQIEPNLDNYSVAEILFLAFERTKTALLLSENNDYDAFLIKKKIFYSKIQILESRSTFSDSFYYDDEFIKNVALLKQQYRTLDDLSTGLLVGQKNKTDILSYMDDIEGTLVDIQEIIYRIQIKNFTEVKGIIQDNSSKAEMFALFSLILVFLMMFLVLRNAFSLKEIIKNKNIFISSIYHEIAGSTQAIVIAADIMEHELAQEELKKEARLISYHGNKITEQTREVMDYSRLEMGEVKVNISTFRLNEVVDDAMTSISAGRGNRIVVRRSSYVGLICSDKYKLYRILANLLSNADKFTHHGAIILNVKVCHGNLYLWVKDTGIGFNVDNLERLYKAFNQGVERETRQGLGLGLTIIKNYVTTMKGAIKVKSVEGVGSSFLIRIPVKLIKE